MCGHIDQVTRITCVLLLASIWCTGTGARDQDGCTKSNHVKQTEICIISCHKKISIVVTLNLNLNGTNSSFITNNIPVTSSVSSVLKVVTQDNINWSVFVNDELLANYSVPTEGYRFGGWFLESLGEFKVLDGECKSLNTTLSDTTVARTTTGEIKPHRYAIGHYGGTDYYR